MNDSPSALSTIFEMVHSGDRYPPEVVVLSLLLGYGLLVFLAYLCVKHRAWGWLVAVLAAGWFLPSFIIGVGFWLTGWAIFIGGIFLIGWLFKSRESS